LIGQGAFPGDHLKILMKAGEVIKAAFITKPFDALVVFNKQFAGMAHSQFDQELRISFPGSGFKIPAEGICHKWH
jgi:hypothetical protein